MDFRPSLKVGGSASDKQIDGNCIYSLDYNQFSEMIRIIFINIKSSNKPLYIRKQFFAVKGKTKADRKEKNEGSDDKTLLDNLEKFYNSVQEVEA